MDCHDIGFRIIMFLQDGLLLWCCLNFSTCTFFKVTIIITIINKHITLGFTEMVINGEYFLQMYDFYRQTIYRENSKLHP